MISKNISLNLKACLSGEAFSFDELIIETKNLFEQQGIPGFLKLLISFTNKMVISDAKTSESTSCCENPYLIRNGNRSKNICTSLGNIDFEWTTLRCKNCGKVHHPLKDFFELGKYQSVSNEFEKTCMETVAKESFRRSAQTLKTHTESKFSFRSLHR